MLRSVCGFVVLLLLLFLSPSAQVNGSFADYPGSVTCSVGGCSVTVGDFDSDGNLDLAVSNAYAGDVRILLANGDGTFRPGTHYPAGTGAFPLTVGDFNGDGKLDLAVANVAENDISILLGNGDETFQAAKNYGSGSEPAELAVGDSNGDGKLDLAPVLTPRCKSIGMSPSPTRLWKVRRDLPPPEMSR